MHICYICREYPSSLRAGGIASYVKEIAIGMKTMGHTVTVVTASDDTRLSSDHVEDGIRIIRLSGGDFWLDSIEPGYKYLKARFIWRFHSYRKKIRKVVESIPNIDLIEVADYGAESLYLQDLDIPIVVRLHTPSLLNRLTLGVNKKKWYSFLNLNAEKRVLENAKYLSSCSQSLLDWVQGHLNISPRLSHVIFNPVSLVSIGEYYKKEKNCKVIFYAGTIVPTKGIGELVEAWLLLNDKLQDKVNLVIAGKEGSYAEQLKGKISDKDKKYIQFLGKINREDLFPYYQFADVCCFPSWWENMPMVCLEAMLCGGIVIGSTSGGMREIICDGVNGFLVKPKSVNELADCLEKVLCLPNDKKQIVRKNALDTIHNYFSLDVISRKMEKFYKEVYTDYSNMKM